MDDLEKRGGGGGGYDPRLCKKHPVKGFRRIKYPYVRYCPCFPTSLESKICSKSPESTIENYMDVVNIVLNMTKVKKIKIIDHFVQA